MSVKLKVWLKWKTHELIIKIEFVSVQKCYTMMVEREMWPNLEKLSLGTGKISKKHSMGNLDKMASVNETEQLQQTPSSCKPSGASASASARCRRKQAQPRRKKGRIENFFFWNCSFTSSVALCRYILHRAMIIRWKSRFDNIQSMSACMAVSFPFHWPTWVFPFPLFHKKHNNFVEKSFLVYINYFWARVLFYGLFSALSM